jgi:hypothetical protein
MKGGFFFVFQSWLMILPTVFNARISGSSGKLGTYESLTGNQEHAVKDYKRKPNSTMQE